MDTGTVSLITHRTRLRRFTPEDLVKIRRLESDADVVRHTRIRQPLSLEQSEQRLKTLLEKTNPDAPLGVWAAEFKDSHEFIGWFMLMPKPEGRAELGYMIVKDLWGQGLATEISAALIESAFFNLNIDAIEAVTDRGNTGSARILDKLNFKVVKQDQDENSIFFELKNYR